MTQIEVESIGLTAPVQVVAVDYIPPGCSAVIDIDITRVR